MSRFEFEKKFLGRKYSNLVIDKEQERIFEGLCEPIHYDKDGTIFLLNARGEWELYNGSFLYSDKSQKGLFKCDLEIDRENALKMREHSLNSLQELPELTQCSEYSECSDYSTPCSPYYPERRNSV